MQTHLKNGSDSAYVLLIMLVKLQKIDDRSIQPAISLIIYGDFKTSHYIYQYKFFCSYMLYPLNLIFSLEEFCNFLNFFSLWHIGFFCFVTNRDDCNYIFCLRNIKHLTNSFAVPDSHD